MYVCIINYIYEIKIAKNCLKIVLFRYIMNIYKYSYAKY